MFRCIDTGLRASPDRDTSQGGLDGTIVILCAVIEVSFRIRTIGSPASKCIVAQEATTSAP
jgi:hypothetical protein